MTIVQNRAANSEVLEIAYGGVSFRVQTDRPRRAYWERFSAGQWEPQTLAALRHFLSPKQSFIDCGAWIGPTALYGAHFARQVYALEPDPVAFAELSQNVALNPDASARIVLCELCLAPEPGPVTLFAGGAYHSQTSRFGDSMSSIVASEGHRQQDTRTAQGVRLEDFMADNAITDCGCIKMDVEGAEYSLIIGRWRRMAAFGSPTLHLSFHAPALAERARLIGDCLEELQGCYRWLYSALDHSLLDPSALLAEIADWSDDSPASPWSKLDTLLGAGIVASNRPW